MDDEIIKKIVEMKPSEFYSKVWKGYFSGKLSKEKKDKLVEIYEDNNKPIESELDSVFEMEPDFLIHTPIWETKSVGLNENRLKDNSTVKIAYRDKDGVELYPDTYTITKEKAMSYPKKKIRGNTLRIIPIKELDYE